MRNGIPIAYATFRALWTILHLGLVSVAVAGAAVWFLQDNQGMHLITGIGESLSATQRAIANAIPYPWGR